MADKLPPPPPGVEFIDEPPPPAGVEFVNELPPPPEGVTFVEDEPSTFQKVISSRPVQAGLRGLSLAAKVLEPLRESTVGLGGIAAGAKAAFKGEPILESAAKSVESRAGLGRELVDATAVEEGWKKEVASVVAEIATDPLTYIPITALGKVIKNIRGTSVSKAPLVVTETISTKVLPKPELIDELNRIKDIVSNAMVDADAAGLRIAPTDVLTESERVLYGKFKTPIQSSIDFKVPLAPLISESEKQAFRGTLEATQNIPEIAKIVEEPLSSLPKNLPPPVPATPGQKFGPAEKASAIVRRLDERVSAYEELNERAKLAVEHIETIQETGTLPKDVRPDFRKTKPASEADIQAYRVSKQTVQKAQSDLANAVRELKSVKAQLLSSGDNLSANAAVAVSDEVAILEKKVNTMVERYSLERFAVNRAMNGFNTPIPKDIIDALKETGLMIGKLKEAKEKVPIATNILEGMKKWGSLTGPEKQQVLLDVLDHVRLNLFAPLSFSLDMLGNATEIGAQAIGGLGHDFVRAVKGSPDIPATRALFRTLRERKAGFSTAELTPAIEEGLGITVSGERVGGSFTGKGTFTRRESVGSAIYDYLAGTPLYLKGFIDTSSKRFAAMLHVNRAAMEEAARLGLKGSEKQAFYKQFVENLPENVANAAIEKAQKAGFSRELTKIEERYAASPVTKLFVDTFARWPLQFSRWGAEMLGYNPKVLAGKATAEEMGEWLAKSATGWGGLYFVNENIYDRVDFNTMQYIHPSGDPVRLSNREPLASALWLLAVIKGDKEKAIAGLKFASVPGSKGFEGGLLSGILSQFQNLNQSRDINPRKMSQELTDTVNRLIPGQALLGLVKTLIDPVIRTGVGANIPGVSLALPPVIKPTTGQPLAPRQRVPGTSIEVPSVLGTAVPGAQRVLDPLEKLLMTYGISVGRGLRTPIAGVPANSVPDSIKSEWLKELGAARQQVFGRVLRDQETLDRWSKSDPAIVQKIIKNMDASAASIADAKMLEKFGYKIPQKQAKLKAGAMPTVRPTLRAIP